MESLQDKIEDFIEYELDYNGSPRYMLKAWLTIDEVNELRSMFSLDKIDKSFFEDS
jgi:hypothetical protein